MTSEVIARLTRGFYSAGMDELSIQTLVDTKIVTLRDVACRGSCRHRSAEECASAEIAPGKPTELRRRISTDAQSLLVQLRHRLVHQLIGMLEAESMALALARCALGERALRGTPGKQKLVERAKLVLASDLARRWTLSDVANEVGVSPVYLTQVFKQVEGVPLYRYQLRLRLARALDLLEWGRACQDISALSMDLGFSSHSHFTASFRRAYGCTPMEFRRSIHKR